MRFPEINIVIIKPQKYLLCCFDWNVPLPWMSFSHHFRCWCKCQLTCKAFHYYPAYISNNSFNFCPPFTLFDFAQILYYLTLFMYFPDSNGSYWKASKWKPLVILLSSESTVSRLQFGTCWVNITILLTVKITILLK